MIAEKMEQGEQQKLINRAGKILLKKNSTVAVAESVTSGNLQAFFSQAENATLFFQGGITAYNIGQKCRHLHVEPTDALEYNCVSKKVADQMALEVCRLFSAGYGIAITGYASPVPEQDVQDLFAFISIADNNRILLSRKVKAPLLEPSSVQLFYTHQCVKMFVSALGKKG